MLAAWLVGCDYIRMGSKLREKICRLRHDRFLRSLAFFTGGGGIRQSSLGGANGTRTSVFRDSRSADGLLPSGSALLRGCFGTVSLCRVDVGLSWTDRYGRD